MKLALVYLIIVGPAALLALMDHELGPTVSVVAAIAWLVTAAAVVAELEGKGRL